MGCNNVAHGDIGCLPEGYNSHCCCCQHHPQTTSLHILQHPEFRKLIHISHFPRLTFELPREKGYFDHLGLPFFLQGLCLHLALDTSAGLLHLNFNVEISFWKKKSLSFLVHTSQSSYSLNSVLRGLTFSWGY